MASWKPVPGFPNYVAHPNGSIRHVNKNTPIKPQKNASGYMTVSLVRDGQAVTRNVHEVIGQTFIPGYRRGKHSVNHLDRNRGNNAVKNLEWVDTRDNKGHGRITKEGVRAIRGMLKDGKKPAEIAKMLRIREGVVNAVARETTQDK
jgi:hypothetical protein